MGIAEKSLEHSLDRVRSLVRELDDLAETFHRYFRSGGQYEDAKFHCDYWKATFFLDAITRLKGLIEVNLRTIDTMGLLAVTRYVFEASIWARLLDSDSDRALEYYFRLLDGNRRYYDDLISQLQREIQVLSRFSDKDDANAASIKKAVIEAQHGGEPPEAIVAIIENAMTEVDTEADELFSLYADQAKVNGYGFQAHLVSEKALPAAEKALASVKEAIREFESAVEEGILAASRKCWKWKDMAVEVGMADEYEFIYTYTSRLMHATPASLTTDQKDLQTDEIAMFLRYIRVKLDQLVAIARSQPEFPSVH